MSSSGPRSYAHLRDRPAARLREAAEYLLLNRRARGKRNAARERPEQGAPQTVNVRTNVHRAGVLRLLGRQVIDRSQHHALLRMTIVHAACQAEIEQLRRAFRRDQDIGRLDVAMHHVVLFRFHQGVGDLASQVAGAHDGKGAVGLHQVFEILAGHIFHDVIVTRGKRIRHPSPEISPVSIAPTMLG